MSPKVDINVDNIIEEFRLFLNSSWKHVEKIFPVRDRGEDFYADWIQANWERLVEAAICSYGEYIRPYVTVYSGGSDLDISSRVWKSDVASTHEIYCELKDIRTRDILFNKTFETKDLPFYGFVHWDGKIYDEKPPFDHVVIRVEGDYRELLLPRESVIFKLRKFED